MITSVKITNFVIVEDLEINLMNGLIALTGETGAGKSVLVGAIDSVFGGKIKPGSLFNESEPAIIELAVELDAENNKLLQLLKENDFDLDENEIFFRKEINVKLQGRYYLNGRRISRQIITEFRDLLLDFHSQRDQQRLFDSNYQLEVLDAYADLLELRKEYTDLYTEILAKYNELQSLEEQEKNDQDRMKLYEFQLNEIRNLKLSTGEDDAIQAELNLLHNSQDIIENANLLEQQVYEKEDSIYDILNNFLSRFREFAADDVHIKNAVEHLEGSLLNLDDAVAEIKNLLDYISVDEERQLILDDRLNEINRLKQKYNQDIDGIFTYAGQIEIAINKFSSKKEKLSQLKEELAFSEKILYKKAEELSSKRKLTAGKLEKEIMKNIKDLAIAQADVKITFANVSNTTVNYMSGLNSTGKDEVDILFSANAGIKVQPLKYAASGGELSRFLLVIKKILTNKLENKTIIFDEIDAGIGGKTANLLGDFIKEIGNYHQILCITHLAQIAVYAQQHFSIVKTSDNRKAVINITQLGEIERKEEIARMLSGSDSELALKYAEEIIAEKEKN
ncbi:DNA repair protein RecN [Candidatus Cloacimonadota bacterium]